jgi:hypothetical protein
MAITTMNVSARPCDCSAPASLHTWSEGHRSPDADGQRNEILYSLHDPAQFTLSIVEFMEDSTHRVHYTRRPFQREPDFGAANVNYFISDLLARAEDPS